MTLKQKFIKLIKNKSPDHNKYIIRNDFNI